MHRKWLRLVQAEFPPAATSSGSTPGRLAKPSRKHAASGKSMYQIGKNAGFADRCVAIPLANAKVLASAGGRTG